MMGRLETDQEQLFYSYRLDELVPADHLVRKIDGDLDLSWLRAGKVSISSSSDATAGVRISIELVGPAPAALPLSDARMAPRRATLRSQAVILSDVAADLAGRDQPFRYFLLHVPEADLFALQPTGKPVKGC
jgi:hypothetical protein